MVFDFEHSETKVYRRAKRIESVSSNGPGAFENETLVRLETVRSILDPASISILLPFVSFRNLLSRDGYV